MGSITSLRDLTIAKNVVAWITANQTNLSTPSPSDVKAGEIFLFEKSSQEPGSRWVDRRSWEQVSRRQFQNMGCEISEEKRASDSLLTGPRASLTVTLSKNQIGDFTISIEEDKLEEHQNRF